MLRRTAAVLLLLFATNAFAQQLPLCGSSEANDRRVEALGRWSRARLDERASKGLPLGANATIDNNVITLSADELTAPFRKPVDLAGKSVLFTRKDASTFTRQNVALAYDEDTGVLQRLTNGTVGYTLKNFSFPFFDRSVTQLVLSGNNAIFLGTPPSVTVDQLNDAEVAALTDPMIAPLFTTKSTQGGTTQLPAVYVKETTDALTVTWRASKTASYDIQAVLFKSGDIRFAYKRIDSINGGVVVVSSGHEDWRNRRETLMNGDDASSDLRGAYSATMTPLLDIQNASLQRIDGTDLLEVRIKVAGPKSTLGANERVVYSVFFGDPKLQQVVQLLVAGNGATTYALPTWGGADNSPAGRMENDTVVLDMLQGWLVGSLDNLSVRVYSQSASSNVFADSLNLSGTVAPPVRNLRSEFRNLSGVVDDTHPMLASYTLPVLNVQGVYQELQSAYGLKDTDFDGLAVYPNFYSDIIYYAGAYCFGGNPGADGISTASFVGAALPRVPALMHMNSIGYGYNSDDDLSGHVILHEFGHHWLLNVTIDDGGTQSRVLNPVSAHPAQYVDTRAAFRVNSDSDASVMGGSTFTISPDGSTFAAPPVFSNFGYSWLDLYLMGLASPDEVHPFFYIANSAPKLGDAYYPPADASVSGIKKDVALKQVTDVMGPRLPAYPDTQRRFRVLFVLLADPDRPYTGEEMAKMQNYRRIVEQKFATATGGRASMTTEVPVQQQHQPPQPGPPPNGRRRAIGH